MSTSLQRQVAMQSPMFYTRNCYDRPMNPLDEVELPASLKAENMTVSERKLLRQNLKSLKEVTP